MSLRELFAFMKAQDRRSVQRSTEEEGALIRRRLQELLAVPSPTQEVETLFPKPVLNTARYACRADNAET